MRKVLAAIRKVLSAMAVPVVMLVDGVWRVVQALRPQPSTALEDEADEVLDEAPSARPGAREAYDAMVAEATSGEEARVRRAAQSLLRREPIPTEVLDPALGRDARILGWLKSLDAMELATVVQLRPELLRQHLEGKPGAALPPVRKPTPAADEIVQEMDAAPAVSRRRAA